MLTIIFVILLISAMLSVVKIAIKLTWGLLKILAAVIFFPVILVVLFVSGLIYLVIAILAIVLVLSLLGNLFL